MSDTPAQYQETTGCPQFPHPSCNNTSDMFMNYMDYTNDACMNLFTNKQKDRMIASLTTLHYSLINSKNCVVGITKIAQQDQIVNIYPQPLFGNILNVQIPNTNSENINISILNIIGQSELSLTYSYFSDNKISLDLKDLKQGIHFIKLNLDNYSITKKIIKL